MERAAAPPRRKGKPKLPPVDMAVQNQPVVRMTEEDREVYDRQAFLEGPQVMSEVRPWLFLGSVVDALDLKSLERHGVTHVLNAAKECDSVPTPDLAKCAIVYKKLDLVDHTDQPIIGVFEEAFEFVETAKRAGGKVLVHCHRGISRSATLVIAYIMKTEGIHFDDAMENVRRVRSIVNPNLGFVLSLQSYQQQIIPVHRQAAEADRAALQDAVHAAHPSPSIGCAFDQIHDPYRNNPWSKAIGGGH